MQIFRRFFFFIAVNLLIVLTASAVVTLVMHYMGLSNQWYYILFYSLIGFGGAFFSLFISKWSAKKMMGVRIIDPHTVNADERKLVEVVHDLARSARLPKAPEVGIYEGKELNAFATGPSKKNSLVAVSRGLLSGMDEDELRGVLGHEVAHIANGDMVTMTLLQGLINTMVLLAARMVAKLIVSQQRQRSFFLEYMIYIGLQVVFSIFGTIVLCFSQDEGSIVLMKGEPNWQEQKAW